MSTMIFPDLPEPKTASRYYDELLSQIVHFTKYLSEEKNNQKRKQIHIEILRLKSELFKISKLEPKQLVKFKTVIIQSKINYENYPNE